MNTIILSGRLTKDIEIKTTSNGTNYTRFGLAVDKYKDKQKSVIFVDCVAFNYQSNFLNKYCHKGSRVTIAGELDVSVKEYEDGTKRTFYTVIANQVEADMPPKQNDEAMPFEL